MSVVVTDRIEKRVLLRAPPARVWKALTDLREFQEWFGVKFDRPFTPGALLRGVIVVTMVDAGVDGDLERCIPLERRSQAFTSNDEGWSIMVKLIETYLARTA